MDGADYTRGKSGRHGDDGSSAGEERLELPKGPILLTEISAPVNDTMGFVDKHGNHVAHKRRALKDTAMERAGLKHLGGDQNDLVLERKYVLCTMKGDRCEISA